MPWSTCFADRRATLEVKQFVKQDKLAKIAVEKEGILFCRSRLLGQRFILTAGLENTNFLHPSDLNIMTPLVDRFSPLAYSIAEFIHQVHAKHAGYESCYRMSLNYCHILQAASLFREISEDCVKCAMLRKKYIEAAMTWAL